MLADRGLRLGAPVLTSEKSTAALTGGSNVPGFIRICSSVALRSFSATERGISFLCLRSAQGGGEGGDYPITPQLGSTPDENIKQIIYFRDDTSTEHMII